MKPYYTVLDEKVITPVTVYGKRYGAPRVAQAQKYGRAQWDKSVQPQVTKINAAAQDQYAKTLAPHVDKVVTVAGPYYVFARDNAVQTYHTSILPTYNALQPHVKKAYKATNAFAIDIGIPYTKWAWTSSLIFLDRTVLPKLRILYGENVEPQLVRIGERLGRYRDGKRLQAAVDAVDVSISASSASSSFSSVSSSIASAHGTDIVSSATASVKSAVSSVVTEQIPLSSEEAREKAKIIVAEDLKTWQEKFAKAADQGSDELDERIAEIADRLVEKQARDVGESLLIQLEETVKSEIKSLKSSIISIVKGASAPDKDLPEEQLGVAVRKAGGSIKDKAQAVRSWRQNFDQETIYLVSKAAEDTFEIIDHIRDLGLQEIGMRWAWTDGITHKDWIKYHALKNKFDEWRKDVEQVAVAHPGLLKAREASEDVESRAMAIAEDAVKELARLKETARWKISAGDDSDDFSTNHVPAPVAVAGEKILDQIHKASEAVAGTTQGTVESWSSVAISAVVGAASSASSLAASHVENAQTVLSDVSSSGIASSISSDKLGAAQDSAESIASVAKSSANSAANAASSSANSLADQFSSSLVGTAQKSEEKSISVASESATSVSEKVSASIAGGSPGVAKQAYSSNQSGASSALDANPVMAARSSVSSVSSVVSDAVSSASSSAAESASATSNAISPSASSALDEASASADSVSEAGSSAASSATGSAKKVWGGAVAQYVEAKQIVYEDIVEDDSDASYSEKIQSIASEAGDRFSDITQAVSDALLKSTPTKGSYESITSLAAGQYSSALSAASVALYGTEQGVAESVASVATGKYSDAVAA